jgi:hypothetical protein
MFTREGQESPADSSRASQSTANAKPEAMLVAGQHRGNRGRHRRVTRRRAALVSAIVCVLGAAGLAVAGIRTAPARAETVGIWSGQVVNGGPFFQVTADFTAPALTCPPASSTGMTGYWVGLKGTSAIIQTGVAMQCLGGSPVYHAWTANTAGGATYLPNPVQNFDFIALGVNCAGSACVMNLNDMTQGWSQSVGITAPSGFSAGTAAVAAESFSGGTQSSPVVVDNATVNGDPLGQSNPQANIQDPSIYGGTADLVANPLDPSGTDFSFSWITL